MYDITLSGEAATTSPCLAHDNVNYPFAPGYRRTTYCKGKEVVLFALLVELFVVLLDAGCPDGEDFPFRDCSPPTTPPTIAAASTMARTRPKSSQKCFCRRPHILFSCGGGESRASSSSLGPIGDMGLSVPSGEVGIAIGTPTGMPACACFSLR